MARTVSMDSTAKKLVMSGIGILIAGVLVEGLASWLIAAVFDAGGPNREVGVWLLGLISRVTQIGLGPLGAALIAIGIALRWLPERTPAAARQQPGLEA